MKKIIYIIIAIYLYTFSISFGEIDKNEISLLNIDLLDVDWKGNDIFIYGNYNYFLHSSDNGLSWVQSKLPINNIQESNFLNKTYNEKSMYFINNKVGFLNIYNGNATILYKTRNSGISWDSISVFNQLRTNSLLALNENLVLITTDNLIIKSDDGGKSWKNLTILETLSYYNIETIRNNSILVNTFDNKNKIYQTYISNNEGKNWEIDSSNMLSNSIYGISHYFEFSDNNKIKFNVVFDSLQEEILYKENFITKNSKIVLSYDFPNFNVNLDLEKISISFKDSLNGILVGMNKTIFITSDGGESWNLISNLEANRGHISYTSIDNKGNFYITGKFNSIYKSTNSGITWHPILFDKNQSLNYYNQPKFLIIDSTNFILFNEGGMYYSDDGNSFKKSNFDTISIPYTKISYFTNNAKYKGDTVVFSSFRTNPKSRLHENIIVYSLDKGRNYKSINFIDTVWDYEIFLLNDRVFSFRRKQIDRDVYDKLEYFVFGEIELNGIFKFNQLFSSSKFSDYEFVKYIPNQGYNIYAIGIDGFNYLIQLDLNFYLVNEKIVIHETQLVDFNPGYMVRDNINDNSIFYFGGSGDYTKIYKTDLNGNIIFYDSCKLYFGYFYKVNNNLYDPNKNMLYFNYFSDFNYIVDNVYSINLNKTVLDISNESEISTNLNHSRNSNISISPNPGSDKFQLDISKMNFSDYENLRVALTNIFGQEVQILFNDLGSKLNSSILSFSTSEFTQGVYFVNITNSTGVLSKQFVVIR